MVRKLLALLGFCAIPLAAGCHELGNALDDALDDGSDCLDWCTFEHEQCAVACGDNGDCIKACDDDETECVKTCHDGETD
jgi:hypothetical protein